MEKTLSANDTKPRRSFVQSALRLVLPKDETFYVLLERQIEVADRAANKLAELSKDNVEKVSAEIQELEHEGDAVVHQLEESLASTYFTPIDREDIVHLSALLDNVLDFTNSTARACWMCGVDEPTAAMKAMIGILGQMTALLKNAVASLRLHNYADVIETCRKVRALESEGDKHFRAEIRTLFHDDAVDAKRLLAVREVLKALESALDNAEDLADQLIVLAVKNG